MQSEAVSIAKKSDIMVIIGGRESSNTEKLRNVCSEHCPTILIERADELEPSMYKGVKTVGITAGASTPADIIKEVLSTMSEIINTNEKEFDEAQFPADTALIRRTTLLKVRNRALSRVLNRPLNRVLNRSLSRVRNRPLNRVRNRPLNRVRNRALNRAVNWTMNRPMNRAMSRVWSRAGMALQRGL